MQVGFSSGASDMWSVHSIPIKGRILDLSTGGASLFTKDSFQTGQELALAIKLHDASEIHAKASVRWIKSVPEKGGYASGVQFVHVADKDASKIQRFLKDLDATVGL